MPRPSDVIKKEIDEKEDLQTDLTSLRDELDDFNTSMGNMATVLENSGNLIKEVGKIGGRTLDNNGKFGEKASSYRGFAGRADIICDDISGVLSLLQTEIDNLRIEYQEALDYETMVRAGNSTSDNTTTVPKTIIIKRSKSDVFTLLKY